MLADGIGVAEHGLTRDRFGELCGTSQLHGNFAPFVRVRTPEHFGSGAMNAT
jgi:hypothetical protein